MRFLLNDIDWLGGPRAAINSLINFGGISLTTTFLVDTGSPFTIISENDLKKTRLAYTKCEHYQRIIIGTPMDLKKLGEAQIIFKDETGNSVPFSHPVYVGIIVNRNQELIKRLSLSFLGKDFLDKYNLCITKKDETGQRRME